MLAIDAFLGSRRTSLEREEKRERERVLTNFSSTLATIRVY